jgi:hypothetical protein
MNRFFTIILFGSVLFALPLITEGQTVRIDAAPSHVTNKFRPSYALGSTVDRVPSNPTDTFFRPDQIKQILSAGWGIISYRQGLTYSPSCFPLLGEAAKMVLYRPINHLKSMQLVRP